MGPSTDEAAQLVAAYRACAGRLEPLRTMLATPADQFATPREAVEADDAPLMAAFDELRPLAKQTVEWLRRAADHVWRQERDVGEDEASLRAARDEIAPVRNAARELVDEAVPALNVGQRAALARHMVVDCDLYDQLWGPNGKHRGDPAPAATLDHFVDQQLETFLARSRPFAWLANNRWSALAPQAFGPKWAKGPIPWRPVLPKRPRLRRWRDLQQPMQAIERYGREIDGAYERVRAAHDQADAARQRAELAAKQERDRQAREAEDRRRAQEAEQVDRQAETLRQRFEAFVRGWRLSSQQLHDHGWGQTLLRQLTHPDGICDADGALVGVTSLGTEEARYVLALLQLPFDHDEHTAQRLRKVLTDEDGMLNERARLHAAAADLPVAPRTHTDLASLHPHFRRAYEWLAHNMDAVVPILEGQEPDKAPILRDALIEAQRADE